jgi:hypothetical protein
MGENNLSLADQKQVQRFVTSLFLTHILATCGISVWFLSLFWNGSPIYSVDTSVPSDWQIGVQLVVGIIFLYAISLAVRKKKMRRVKAWMVFGIVSFLYGLTGFTIASIFVDILPALFLAGLFAATYFLCATYWRTTVAKIMIPILTLMLSVFVAFALVISLPLVVIGVLTLGYAAYDIFAVFWGPLKHLIQTLRDNKLMDILAFSGLVTPIKGRILGLGDSIFYATLFSSVYLNLGPFAGLLSLSGIVAGFLLTFSLAKEKPMPALPLSISLGVALAVLGHLI